MFKHLTGLSNYVVSTIVSAKRLMLFALIALTMLAPAKADAAVSTWVAAGSTSNFSDNLNWDAPPTPDCDLVFAANAFASKGAPVNDLVGLDVNAINIYEAYNITGNAITCKVINDNNATIATVNLPISTFGSAVLTVTVTTAGATLNLPGILSGAGPATYGGPGTTRLCGTVNNTLSGLTSVAMGNLLIDSAAPEAIAGPMIIDSGAIATIKTAPGIKNSVAVIVNGTLDLSPAVGNEGTDTETIGGLSGNGVVNLGAATLGCTAQASPTNYLGSFIGTGSFRQSISGTQILSGNASSSTGPTVVAGGELHIWGVQTASPVVVTSGTLLLANDSSVGDVTLSGGSVLTFDETITAMNLHSTTPNLVVGNGSTFHVTTRGAPPTLYSYVTTGSADVSGALLTIDTTTYAPAPNAVMIIIENTGAPVVGTFLGLPENSQVASSTDPTVIFTISYIGGTGNSVTLTRGLPIADVTPPVISAITTNTLTVSSTKVSWLTNEASDTQVQYGLTNAYGTATTLSAAAVLTHSATIVGLVPDTIYHFRVLSRDSSGNLATSVDGTFKSAAPAPVVQNDPNTGRKDQFQDAVGGCGAGAAGVLLLGMLFSLQMRGRKSRR